MKKLLFLSVIALGCSTFTASAQTTPQFTNYGAAFIKNNVLSPGRLDYMMKDKQKIENMQLSGYISEVCQKEGCWIRFRTDKSIADDMIVKMKDHQFALPTDAAGKRAVVHGTVVRKTQSVEEQRHLLEDAGASAAEIAKITAPKEIFEMQATGVQILAD